MVSMMTKMNLYVKKLPIRFIQQVEELKAKHENVYQQLLNEVKENQDNFNLVTKNEEIHNKQFDYLLKRYLLNIERENDISMRQFRELI